MIETRDIDNVPIVASCSRHRPILNTLMTVKVCHDICTVFEFTANCVIVLLASMSLRYKGYTHSFVCSRPNSITMQFPPNSTP